MVMAWPQSQPHKWLSGSGVMQSGLIVSCFRWRAAKATASSKPGRPRAEHMLALSTLDALELVRAIAALLSAFLSSLNTLPYTLNKCGAVCPSADPGVNWKYMRCQTLKYDFAPCYLILNLTTTGRPCCRNCGRHYPR